MVQNTGHLKASKSKFWAGSLVIVTKMTVTMSIIHGSKKKKMQFEIY